MLGIKFYRDTPKDLVRAMIERAARDHLGIEFLMVQHISKQRGSADEVAWILDETPFVAVADRILHLDNINTFGASIFQPDVYASFEDELKLAQRFGIAKAVMHYNDRMPFAERGRTEQQEDDLKRINELGARYGVTIHIENTLFADAKADVDYYEDMFERVAQHGLDHIGFCFDMGHGKALSNTPLSGWMAFLDELTARHVGLHFHLHNNFGERDDHLSFRIAEESGLNEGDAYTGGQPYLDVLATILARYSGMKLLEVKDSEALPNLDWVQAQLAVRASAA